MTLGAGIFLSAIFLGCVFLYIKSDNKLRWRKTVLFSSVFVVVCFFGFVVYVFFKDDVKNFFIQSTNEISTQKLSIYQIKPGDKLTDIQFQNGKAKKGKERTDGYSVYKYENGIEIWAKGEIADIVFYGCRPTNDSMIVDKSKCGANEDDIFNSYKKKNVAVFCTDDVELRIYEVKDKPINFVLQKNQVIYMGIFRTDENRLRPTNQKPCV